MFPQQAITASLGYRRRAKRGFGLRGLGDDATYADPATVQAALNAAYSPSGTVLQVDGVWGSKSIARMREFQNQVGFPANGNVNDYLTLVGLGIFSNSSQPTIVDAAQQILGQGSQSQSPITPAQQQAVIDLNNAIAQTGTSAPKPSNSYSLMDWLTLKPLTDAFTSSAKTTVQDVAIAGNWTVETAKAAVQGGGTAAQDALKWLGANGDLFAKLALGLGVSYAVATAIVIGGGVALAIVILKKSK